MKESKVSVIVPFYNVGKYLEKCLESLVNQSLNYIEVIMVDDGSTDESGKIAEYFAEENENFRLIVQNHKGVSSARNEGIKNSKGKYIYFIDGDDFLEINALEKLLFVAEEKNLDALKFSAFTVSEDGKYKEWNSYKLVGDYHDIFTGKELLERFRLFEPDNLKVTCWSLFIKRNVLIENEIFFMDGLTNGEDNLFQWMLFMHCARVSILNEPLYYHRVRKGSASNSPIYFAQWRSMIFGASEINKICKQRGKKSHCEVSLYAYDMIFSGTMHAYMRMDDETKKSPESKKIYKLERKVLFENKCWGSKRMFCFAVHPKMLSLYEYIKKAEAILRKG